MPKNFFESQVDFIKSVKIQNLNKNQKIGILSAFVLLVGTFTPVVKVPFIGSISLFYTMTSMAWVAVLSALFSGYLFLYPKVKYIIISNILASLIFLYSLVYISGRVMSYQSEMDKMLKSSPSFSMYPAWSFGNMEMLWLGWLVMLIGIMGIFYAVKSDLKLFYKDVKNKFKSASSENTKSKVVEVESKTKSDSAE